METFSRFVLSEDGTIRTVKVPREQALKEIDELLKEQATAQLRCAENNR